MRRSEPSGFTLLEVLAAVGVLGILFTVLATVATQGLRAEGDSHRRLEAALIADELLTDLEAEWEAGAAPASGVRESEVADFRVSVDVRALDWALPERPQAPRRGTRAREPELGFLRGAGTAGRQNPLRAVEVRVSWGEGPNERSAVRHTYAFDRSAVAELLVAGSEEEAAQ